MNREILFHSCYWLNSAPNLKTVEVNPSQVEPSDEPLSLAGILIAALWDTVQVEDPDKPLPDSWPEESVT